MLNWFVNFGSSILEVCTSLFGFLISLVKGLFELISMLPSIITLLVDSIGFLPSVVSLFASLSIMISIIYLIAGRNNG